jgi:DHA1 family tetracycline resistance protein-like MFS transporter
MTQRIAVSEQGRLQGALNSLRGVSGLLGPVLFTTSFAAGVSQPGSSVASGAPFLVAVALLMLALAVIAPILAAGGSLRRRDIPRRAPDHGTGPLLVQRRT